MITTLACFALPDEARPFRGPSSKLNSVQVLVTGMGRKNTEQALTPVLQQLKPARVLTCGFAGGLDPALALNTLLFETNDSALSAALRGAGLREGRFHCSTRMAVTAAEKAELRRATGADAVEMESAFIHKLCGMHGVPCATVRVISDVAAENLPLDFNKLITADMKLHVGRLAMALLRDPWKAPELMRLQNQTATAARTLAEALGRIVARWRDPE